MFYRKGFCKEREEGIQHGDNRFSRTGSGTSEMDRESLRTWKLLNIHLTSEMCWPSLNKSHRCSLENLWLRICVEWRNAPRENLKNNSDLATTTHVSLVTVSKPPFQHLTKQKPI